MRRGILGSIAALAAGAGTAWGQAPAPVAPAGQPVAVMAGSVIPASGPAPVIMPPIAVGPPGDPMGLGPTASLGPPPGPMYPNPGPYGAPMFQPAPTDGLGGGGGYGNPARWWFDGEYLLWFAKGQPINFPLLTTSAPAASGILGQPSTTELVPARDLSYSGISGFRLSSGFFGDADRRFGAMVTGFYTEQKENSQNFSTGPNSVGIPILSRPFIDTTGVPSALMVADVNLGSGGATISSFTNTWGVEADAVWNLFRSCPDAKCAQTLDFIAGYKFLQTTEQLQISSLTFLNQVILVPVFGPGPFGVPIQTGVRIVPIPVPVGGVFTGFPANVTVVDQFRATNRFNGGVFGLRHELRYGMWSLTSTGKIGIGNMHQVLEIKGGTTFANPQTGNTGASYGGLYANSTNIGKFTHDEFAIIPEMTFNVGVNLTKSVTLFAGYNFIYINKVARPGSQLNPVINSQTVPFSSTFGDTGNPAGSRRLFVQDDFWIQGVNFGMSIQY